MKISLISKELELALLDIIWKVKAANEPDWVKRIRELNDKMKRQ